MAVDKGYRGILPFLPAKVKEGLLSLPETALLGLEEVRLRRRQPIVFSLRAEDLYWAGKGCATHVREAVPCDEETFRMAINLVTASSIYALEEEMRRGYITLPGGHRVGIAGRALLDRGQVRGQRDIASLNYRVAKAVEGAGEEILPLLLAGGAFCNTLIVSPPRCGKTTLLRDLARLLSDGTAHLPPQNIGLVDERSKLSAASWASP